MADYVAFIHKDRKSGYGVSFPDLPGVVTVADTVEGVRKEAEEALALHIEGMVGDGDNVPAPSTLDSLSGDEGFRDAVAVAVIHGPDIATPRWVSGLAHVELRAAERSEKDSRIKSANDVE
jgi:predicted RNase H-like HicB family nuclease